ncbi:MAG: helix-turn-helix transcriptional regulator [Candidatus Thiodiazotropha endolucinida]
MKTTIAQIRGARGLLGWTQKDLAERANISKDTVVKLERSTRSAQSETLEKVIEAFEIAGVGFTDKGGVEPSDKLITLLEGENANYKVLDDVYHSLKEDGGEVLIAGLSEPDENNQAALEFLKTHLHRLQEAGITERILVEEGDTNLVAPIHWYRCVPKGHITNTPFQIYGDRIAMKEFGPAQRILIIKNQLFADTLRGFFNLVWENSSPADTGGIK